MCLSLRAFPLPVCLSLFGHLPTRARELCEQGVWAVSAENVLEHTTLNL
jgi:hypothetical protein